MDPALASVSPLELEVFHGIRNVRTVAIDPSGHQGAVQNPAGRTDEWATLAIFLVARLFPHKDHAGVGVALAEHRLGRVPV
jgi:hypothetical protein